jgi:hypothetical protein
MPLGPFLLPALPIGDSLEPQKGRVVFGRPNAAANSTSPTIVPENACRAVSALSADSLV